MYSLWDVTVNRQAKNTQAWQLEYFLENPENKPIDVVLAKALCKKLAPNL